MAWLMEMGTGKTKVACDEFGRREHAGDLLDWLQFAPASIVDDWLEKELPKHLSEDLWDRALVGVWRSSSRGRREIDEFLRYPLDPRVPRIMLVNTEAMSTVEDALAACRAFLQAPRRSICVVDESTDIAGWRSERTARIGEIGRLADARRVMSGLPNPRSPMQLFSQFEFLDWRVLGYGSIYAFRARYSRIKWLPVGPLVKDRKTKTMRRRKIAKTLGYQRLDELADRIEPFSFRKLKKDCLDLPPKTYMPPRIVEMTSEQSRVYRETRDDCFSVLDEAGAHVSPMLVVTQMLRLHQIACGFVADTEGTEHDLPERRVAELLAVLSEVGYKMLVWAPYDRLIRGLRDRIGREFGRESVAAFWGGNRRERDEEEARFLGDARCQFLVATPGAGGRGKTWTRGVGGAVFFANSWRLEHRLQAEDRNHRDGTEMPQTYVDLMVRGTVDERIVRAMREQIDVATAVLRDGYREWLI
jgi:hypothetical protein